MLREGLRAEIPAVFEAAGRVRRPAVRQTAPALAALAALGAESLTSALLHTVPGVSVLLVGSFPFRATEAVTVVAYAVGVLVAFGSARWRGVAAAVTGFAILWIEQFSLGMPARQAFCARSGSPCDLFTLAVAGVWPQLVGVALGIVAGRLVRPGVPGISALVLGIGIAALAFPIARLAIVPFVGADPTGQSGSEALNWIIAAQAVGAAASGVVVGRFGRWHAADAIVVAIFYLGPWLPQVRFWLEQSPRGLGFVLERDWQLIVPVLYALVALLFLGGGATARRRRLLPPAT